MSRLIRFAVCAALCIALMTAGLCAAPSAATEFYKKVNMVHISSHIEYDAGLNEYATVQGACADGDYAYFAFMQGGVCNIAKYNARTWNYVEKKQIVNMGHSNDMTYNPDKDYLVVANNAPYYDVVTLINPDTLAPIKDVKIKKDIYSIAYNAKHKCYVVGLSGSYDFALLDSDFKVIKEYKGVNTGYTRQGGDCDDDYIYFVQSGGNNILVVYDYSGNHITDIPMSDPDEVENIFHIGSAFYTSLFYYGNTLYRIGFSNTSKIAYNVSYSPGEGEGEMKSTTVNYGTKTKLSKCAFTRDGYLFAGWRVQRTSDDKYIGYRNGADDYEWLDEDDVFNYLYYDDEEPVSETVKFGNIKMTAAWIAERYEAHFDCGEGEGEPIDDTVVHDAEYTIPEGDFSMEGYICDGFTAVRDVDERVYGYRKDSDKPEWLYASDADLLYRFRPGEVVKSLTPEGSVRFTAQYRFAYSFSDDGGTLEEYVGVDEQVYIPGNDGELKTLAEGAIRNNENMRELYIPAGVESIRENAVCDCPGLRSVYFDGALPADIGDASILCDTAPVGYEVNDGKTYYLGFFTKSQSMTMIRFHEGILNQRRSLRTLT